MTQPVADSDHAAVVGRLALHLWRTLYPIVSDTPTLWRPLSTLTLGCAITSHRIARMLRSPILRGVNRTAHVHRLTCVAQQQAAYSVEAKEPGAQGRRQRLSNTWRRWTFAWLAIQPDMCRPPLRHTCATHAPQCTWCLVQPVALVQRCASGWLGSRVQQCSWLGGTRAGWMLCRQRAEATASPQCATPQTPSR